MTCPVWQRLLDDFPRGLPAGAMEQHALGCPECAARQPEIRALLLALPFLSPPDVPDGLQERITAAIVADQRKRPALPRRLASVAALVTAAGLLLAVAAWGWRPVSPAPPEPVAARPTLREAASKAREAGQRLIARTAEDAADQAASLLPPMGPVSLEPNPGPALKPLRETADEVRAGMAPVTNSAQRAVNLFLRDLPLGLKPG